MLQWHLGRLQGKACGRHILHCHGDSCACRGYQPISMSGNESVPYVKRLRVDTFFTSQKHLWKFDWLSEITTRSDQVMSGCYKTECKMSPAALHSLDVSWLTL
ncbi:uncharacterized protein LOC110981824 isoform X2 [Acanthaster planci]|uniref:Uncharacterized protein LOC110981824 isoform X2 n=1 Tax=Acanthaster planci TaxID=133434 RepID=A0A8B7YVY7_ACAPL|nr:uncharacterized protein LOC110981824 isoform X2 [Acanthaster planci]